MSFVQLANISFRTFEAFVSQWTCIFVFVSRGARLSARLRGLPAHFCIESEMGGGVLVCLVSIAFVGDGEVTMG